MQQTFERKVIAGFGLAFVVLVAVGLFAFYSIQHPVTTDRWVAHTTEVLANVEGLLSSVKDAESGQRGYLVTGDDTYLQPYYNALGQIGPQISHLRGLTSDNPKEQDRLISLEEAINTRLETLGEGISIRELSGFEEAQR